jgi:hypothetical protein
MSRRQPSPLAAALLGVFIANAYLADLTGIDVLHWLGV